MPENTPEARPSFGRFICPNCAAINVEPGNCKKCGADLETGEASGSSGTLREMQSPGGLSKKHIVMGGIAVVLLVAALMMMIGGHQESPPANTTTAPAPAASGSEEAAKLATQYAGFKATPPEGYTYTDTSADTPGQKSFGIESERRNQKMVFLVWDNTAPVDDITLLLARVPGTKESINLSIPDNQVDKGSRIVGSGPMPFRVARYTAEDKTHMAMVAAFKSPVEGKAVVVVARPYDDSDQLDYNGSLFVVDTMAADYTAAAKKAEEGTSTEATSTGASQEETPLATPEQLADYRKSVEDAIKANFSVSKDEAKKTKSAVTIGIDSEGKLNKLEISQPSGVEAVDKAVLKAIKAGQPYPAPPHTKDNSVDMQVTTDGTNLAVKEN